MEIRLNRYASGTRVTPEVLGLAARRALRALLLLGVAGVKTKANQLFDELNKKYWRGRLAEYQVIRRAKLPHGLGCCYDKAKTIVLRKNLSGELLRRILLHEMCHIGTPGDHGKPFQDKLRQLIRRGEEWAKEELELYRQFPCASFTHIMLKYGIEDLNYLRGDLEDFAQMFPRPRLNEVISELARYLETSPSDLSQRAPWLLSEWRRVCRKYGKRRR